MMLSGSGSAGAAGAGAAGAGAAGAGVAPDGLVPETAAETTLAPEHFQADAAPLAFTHARTFAPLSPAGGTKMALPAPEMATHLITAFFLTVTFFWVCHLKRYLVPLAAGIATAAVRVAPTWASPVTTGARTAGAACRAMGRAMVAARTAASSAERRGGGRLIPILVSPLSIAVLNSRLLHQPATPATEWAAASRPRCGLPPHRGRRPPAARRNQVPGETR